MIVNVQTIPEYRYRTLLSQYSFERYPRSFGNPKQFHVFDWKAFYDNIIINNGKNSCFTSHNRWGRLGIVNNKELPTQIWYETMFFDFDDVKPENTQLDVINLVDFLDKNSLPYIIQFSGSKGFHVFLYFRPKLFEYKKEDESERQMQILIKRIFRWFKRTLNLRTLDDTVGEPKKLCRLPYTYHVNRKGEVHEEQCVPIPRQMLLKWNVNDIREYSKNPIFIIPEVKSITYDILSFISKFDIKDNGDLFDETVPQLEFKSHVHIQNKELKIYMDLMAKHKPCIVSNLQTMNPDHATRVAFAMYMKRMGISKERFTEIYEALAKENNYIDFYVGKESREYQINHIFDNPSYQNEASCTTIKQKYPHLCLREKCHRYIPNYKKKNKPKPIRR
jgi:hypothetical protein